MRKSISKLIVAGLSLAVSLTAAAVAPQTAMKVSKTKGSVTSVNIASKSPVAGKRYVNSLLGNSKVERNAGTPVQSVQKIKPTKALRPGLSAPAYVAAASSDLYGINLYCDNYDASNGIYTLSTTEDSNEISLALDYNLSSTMGACVGKGKYYVNELVTLWGMIMGAGHYVIDLDSWEVEYTESDVYDDALLTEFATDMTYDASTDMIYGCFYDETGSGFIFGVQDPETFKTTAICPLEQKWNSCACTKDGKLYAIDDYGYVYLVDKSTGDCTYVGDTGYLPKYLGSAAIDPVTKVMYWTLCPADECGYMCAIDLATGEAQVLYQFEDNNEFVGLGFDIPTAEPGAPAAVTEASITFGSEIGAEHVGEICFTMPTKTFAGDELKPGAYPWTVTRNGEVIKEGRAFTGFEVKFTDVVPASGNYTYAVYVSNDEGTGQIVKTKMWVGPDSPVAPQNVVLSYADGAFAVEWDAVDKTVNTGFDVEDVTYIVRLYQDGAMVKFVDGLKDTSLAIEEVAPEDLTLYFATVQAIAPRTKSDLGVSQSIALGHAKTPYFESFDDVNSMAPYTVIDVNEDGRTWTMSSPGILQVLYSGYNDMDDWLITPPIYLEAGKEYTFTINATNGSTYYSERVEALLGTAPTAEDMTTVVIEPVDLLDGIYRDYSNTVVIEESGDYYFGVHGISDADMLYLYLDYIKVSAGVNTNAPDAPVMKAVANPQGELSATVEYTVPSVDLNGNPVSVDKVEVSCNGIVFDVNNDAVAGQTYTATINVEEAGVYNFSVVAFNGNGPGRESSQNIFVGVNVPGVPTNVKMVETATLGEVTLTWDAPAVDADGYPISPELISYIVMSGDGEIVEETKNLTCTYVAAPSDEPAFAFAGVYAVTEAGLSTEPGISNFLPVGAAYELPVIESFDDGYFSVELATESNTQAEWGIYEDADIVPDFDGTNGMLAMRGYTDGDNASLFTAKIHLDSEKPAVAFAYYCIADDDENILKVYLTDMETLEDTLIGTIEMGKGQEETWMPVMIPVQQFAGKTVSLKFVGCIVGRYPYSVILVDQVKVYEPSDYDLAAIGISAPAMVAPGEDFEVEVKVMNAGVKDVNAYKVELMNNGKVVATVDGEPLKVSSTAVVTIPQNLSAVSDQSNVYTAKVVCDGDDNAANDITAEMPVLLDIPNYPAPAALKAAKTDAGVTLTWNEPDLSPESMPIMAITDDFESYEAFTYTNLGDWTLVDADELGVGGAQGVDVPGVELGESLIAYYVMNTEDLGLNESFAAHSGEQYLVSTFPYQGNSAVEDWLISPALDGSAQAVSFWAKSYSSNYPETFQVYYSTTDRELSSFVGIAEFANVSSEWTKYTILLPEGAKYFAVVNVSFDAFMLFVDDATFVPANGEPMELSLVGYNIYRNGVKINDEPVAETSYVDAEGSANDVYQVTVVYAEGESKASNVASVNVVDNPTVGISDAVVSAKISVVNHTIVVAGAQGNVNIFTADGKAVYSAAAAERNTVTVAPGVYVVKAGKSIQKVIVK